MNCSICHREKTSEHLFHCPACARAALYPLRLQHATALLERESLKRQIEHIVNSNEKEGRDTPEMIRLGPSKKHFGHQQILIDLAESKRRIDQISQKADALKAKMQQTRLEIERRKTALAKRQGEVKEAAARLERRRTILINDINKGTRRINLQYDKDYKDVVSARIYLCREVARLAGLRQRQYKSEDGRFMEEYSLGGIPIVDLQDFNKASPTHITASLTNISRLLILVCGYLNLKLPAEIIIPHNDYPLPTIFPPSSSYITRNVPFPGTTPLSSTQNSPTASRSLDKRNYPRPRPLYVDRKLPTLVREDVAAFGLFIEGATLLAWDITWLCCVAGTKFDSISSLGRNLWLLFGHVPKSKPEDRPPRLGVWSHGTAHNFLGSASTPTEVKNWGTPMRLVDQVRAGLQADITGAEWELVDEKDFDAGDGKSKSGWTKLKSRGGPEP